MLSGLFKPGWQSDSPEKRVIAIDKMSSQDDSNQSIFEELALNDSSSLVRLTCIKKIRNAKRLFRVYQNQTEQTVKQAASSAFCSLIGSSSPLSKADFESLLSEYSDSSTLVAQHCPYPDLRLRLIDSFSQSDRASIIAEVNYSDTRLHIAESLVQIEALENARRYLKGKDKKAEKVIRAKLETHRAQQKLENSVNETALTLCEQMEFIANHPEWRSEFKDKYELYQQRWNALKLTPADDLIKRFDHSAHISESKVERQVEHEQAEHNQQEISGKLEKYCRALAPLSLSELVEEHLSINTVLSEALATWLENTALVPPSTLLSTRFLNAQQALSSLSDLIETTSQEEIDVKALRSRMASLNWHESYAHLSAADEAKELLDNLRQQSSALKKEQKDSLDALHKRISRLLSTSNKGDIKKAKYELSATNKAASCYSGKERKILDDRLEMAAEIVSKMNDWQNFAIEPKLVELCESMEQLVDSKAHPDKLAKEILKLQNTWKTLGHSDISDQHWQRFKAAADLAYAPCYVFFEQRKVTQKNNLAKREPLIDQMQVLLNDTNWDNTPDYKSIEVRLREINNDWRKVKDVGRKAGQKQWDKLSALRESIYQKLDPIYDANIEQKNQIIRQTISLAEGEVNDGSIDKLKLFQSRWKQVGITRRKQDQEAWGRFRSASDHVFDKVKSMRNERRSVDDKKIAAYRDIIEQIHSLSKSATNLAESDLEFNKLCENYKLLPLLPKTLPDKLVERLESDFQRAGDVYSKAHDRIIQASKDNTINKLREKAALCTRLEAVIIDKRNDEASDLQQKIEAIIVDDKTLNKRFDTRLKAATEVDKTAANKARTLLCIDLEILLDQASPEQDKALRMQVQLERMKDTGIGHSLTEKNNALKELKLDWLCLPGAEPTLQKNLDERFNRLIAAS